MWAVLLAIGIKTEAFWRNLVVRSRRSPQSLPQESHFQSALSRPAHLGECFLYSAPSFGLLPIPGVFISLGFLRSFSNGLGTIYFPHTSGMFLDLGGLNLHACFSGSRLLLHPNGEKEMRMHTHTATLEAGKVLLRKGAPWLDEFRCELLAFPRGKHDDQVDALSQLMTWNERPKHTYSILPMRW